MAKTKPQKLAEKLAIFKSEIEKDSNEVCNKIGDFPKSLIDDTVYEFWLRCETAKDRQYRLRLRAASREYFDRVHAPYYLQFQRQDSQLWKNLDSATGKVYEDWLSQCQLLTFRGYRETSYRYPFSPREGEILFRSLRKVIDFIKSKPSRRYRDLAFSYYRHLIETLFEKTGIQTPICPRNEKVPAYGLKILRDLEFSLEAAKDWGDQHFLTLRPGRYPISLRKAKAYLSEIINEFLQEPHSRQLLGETLLFIWIAISCAYYRRRFCTVSDILKIRESDLISRKPQPWHGYIFPITFFLEIGGEKVPISSSLAKFLLEFSDQRKRSKSIITVDRSSIEGHLKAATIKLGYDPVRDPVTPETFLEQPHGFEIDFR